jgi:hypothetical protein
VRPAGDQGDADDHTHYDARYEPHLSSPFSVRRKEKEAEEERERDQLAMACDNFSDQIDGKYLTDRIVFRC